MAESRSACQTRVHREAAIKRHEVYKMRDQEVRSISDDWKQGFAKLKADNDQRQAALKSFLTQQLAEIDQELHAALAACPA